MPLISNRFTGMRLARGLGALRDRTLGVCDGQKKARSLLGHLPGTVYHSLKKIWFTKLHLQTPTCPYTALKPAGAHPGSATQKPGAGKNIKSERERGVEMSGTDPSLGKRSRSGAYSNAKSPKMENKHVGFHILFPLKRTEMCWNARQGWKWEGWKQRQVLCLHAYVSAAPNNFY